MATRPTRGLLACGVGAALVAGAAAANPYPDPSKVPVTSRAVWNAPVMRHVVDRTTLDADARAVVRVRVDWLPEEDRWVLGDVVREMSGTEQVLARAGHADTLGSYDGRLVDPTTGTAVAFDTIGTGQEYRKLTRAVTFRFPWPDRPLDLVVHGEHPQSGVHEILVTARIDPAAVRPLEAAPGNDLEVRRLKAATASPALIVNVYAEGYTAARRERFFTDAARVPAALTEARFPGLANMEIRAVYRPSAQAIGPATNLGMPIPERDSYLGLYFPYWRAFGRWYNVVYPTREERFRRALADAPYDYPIALVDDAAYWGVGNFRELTAVPARNSNFSYLLLHEFGHFFGLNEEYEGGGATELAFAPGIDEPWSQNITFLADPAALKWKDHVAPSTPVPTPSSRWRSGLYGAYAGGYADTPPRGTSHKPGFACTMETNERFCPICAGAIEARVRFDTGRGSDAASSHIP